jgi:hypothetical protein
LTQNIKLEKFQAQIELLTKENKLANEKLNKFINQGT